MGRRTYPDEHVRRGRAANDALDSRQVEAPRGSARWPVLMLVCLCLFPVLARAQAKDESVVKAAFVFNLTKYVEWPAGVSGKEIVIGFVGEGSMGQVLKQVLSGQSRGKQNRAGHRRAVEGGVAALQYCLRLVFVAVKRSGRLLDRIPNRNVLTIGDVAIIYAIGWGSRSCHRQRSRADPDQSGGRGSCAVKDQLPPAQPCNPGQPGTGPMRTTMRFLFDDLQCPQEAPRCASCSIISRSRSKLTLVVVLASAAALCTLGTVFFVYDYNASWLRLGEHLVTLAQIVGENSTAALEFNDLKAAHEVLTALHSDKQVVSACLYNSKGELFAQYRSHLQPIDPGCPKQPPENSVVDNTFISTVRPVFSAGEKVGTLYLRSDVHEITARWHRLAILAVVLLVLSLGVGAATGSILSRKITTPISELASTMRHVSVHKDYAVRVSAVEKDEIGQLSAGFNEMLADIQARDDELQRKPGEPETRAARARGNQYRTRHGEGAGGGCKPRQERVSRQYEPRDPHPHERRHRHDRARSGNQPHAGTARISLHREALRRIPALDHQRDPGLLQDRSRDAWSWIPSSSTFTTCSETS